MKLQKRFLREVNGKMYYKYLVQIPPEIIKEAKLKEGDELDIKVGKGEVRLRKIEN